MSQPANPVRALPPSHGERTAEGLHGDDDVQKGRSPLPPTRPAQHDDCADGAAAAETSRPKPRVPQSRKRATYSRRNIALANAKSKSKIFQVVHPLHLAAVCFCLIAIGVMIAGLVTSSWFTVSTDTSLAREGLFKVCVEKPTTLPCERLQFGITSAVCNRTSSEVKAINNVVIGVSIGGMALSFITVLISALSRTLSQAPMSLAAIVTAFLAVSAYAAALGLYVYRKANWEYCGTTFCSWYTQAFPVSKCEATFGYSTGFTAIALGSSVVGFAFVLLRFIFREWIIKDEGPTAITSEEAPRNLPPVDDSRAIHSANHEPYEYHADAVPAMDIPPPPDGDWVFDHESGMYWSESEFLFMDPFTQHSYDPNSDMWYDPDAEEWYQGEVIADDGATV